METIKTKPSKKDPEYSYREEKVVIELEVNGSVLSEEENENIQELFKIPKLKGGDTANITFDFLIFYENVSKRLTTILDLWDKAAIIKVNTKALNQNKILIQEVLCKLEKVEKKYKEEP